jgi:anti-sigma factor RsiW
MKTLTDEILNKYIDGELNKTETSEVESILRSSKEERNKLNALREADHLLKNLPVSEIRSDFSVEIMNRIQWVLRSRKEQKKFIITVTSIFIMLCLGIVTVLGIEIVTNMSPASSKVVTDSVTYAKTISENIQVVLNNRNITIVGGLFSFGLIISAYFFFDYNKILRKEMK